MTTADQKAQVALSYVTANGEADPSAPTSEAIRRAIGEYDGSTESEDRIWSAYEDAYQEAIATGAV